MPKAAPIKGKRNRKAYAGLTIYYVTEERAMAPGIAEGWPEIIQAPHTQNGRLRRLSPKECRAIMNAVAFCDC